MRRGHNTWVLTDQHTGNYNGVKVTSDRNIVFQKWDMIFVHGSCPTQDYVHLNAQHIGSKIYYLLVQPSNNPVVLEGMQHAKWIGCGTSFDLEHASKYNHVNKCVPFKYGITKECEGTNGGLKEIGINTPYLFLSVGGFWPHKKMEELARAFTEAGRDDAKLILLGYDTKHGDIPQSTERVIAFECECHASVFESMFDADLLIMNSESEGYGLVLLEAMYNKTPWIARDIAGAHDLHREHGIGKVYKTYEELVELLKNWQPPTEEEKQDLHELVKNNYMISHSVDLLLGVLDK